MDARPQQPVTTEIAAIRLYLANLLTDFEIDGARAEQLYRTIAEHDPLAGHSNLAWLFLMQGRTDEAAALARDLDGLPRTGRALLEAGIALVRGKFGTAVELAGPVFDGSAEEGRFDFSDDYVRVLRTAVRSGFGERLLRWFEETGLADRLAPLHVALRAQVLGEATLNDVSPEIADAATIIHDRLARRVAPSTERAGTDVTRRRKRPRRA